MLSLTKAGVEAKTRFIATLSSVPITISNMFRRYWAEIICCSILLVMGANLLTIVARKTITNDEIVHIPSGYYYLTSKNFRLNPEHPSLIKMWASLPLLVVKPAAPPLKQNPNQDFAQFTMSTSLDFWKANRSRFAAITFWTRFPMVLLTMALGALIFIYGRQLFNRQAALFAVALFSLEPSMIAHGRIVHTDIAAAFAYLLFFLSLRSYCRNPTSLRALGLGLVMSVALLAKFSLVITIPIFLAGLLYVVVVARRLHTFHAKILWQFLLAALGALVLVNAAYFFKHPALARAEVNWIIGTTPSTAKDALFAIKQLSKALPTSYLFGLYTVVVHNQVGHSASLLGDYRSSGWWYYFPVAFGLKTTVPFLLLSLSAVGWAVFETVRRRKKMLLGLLLPIVIYLSVSMSSRINIGIRHLAPVFPFLFLLSGAFLDRLLKSQFRRSSTVLTILLFSWMVVITFRAYPDYIPYTNCLSLGRPGWQLLSDSNVEWGDDVGALAEYLLAHGETKIRGALSGGATLENYGVQLVDFPPPEKELSDTRYVAVGAAFLNGSTIPGGLRDQGGRVVTEEQRHNFLSKYRTDTPEAIFGKSIYLYRAKEQ